jgi:dTDP-4-amino-4,6-dideoxygalactose transaminase
MSPAIRIPAFPAVRLWPTGIPGDWLQNFASLHESGRAALYWALRGLALPKGTTAWMPSYHCGVEVDAAVAAGFEVRFYNVGLNLAIDDEDLGRRMELHPGPVLAIHYFGFRQPGIDRVAALCRKYGCTLIADCAHALFSRDDAGRELGSVAPLAIYSLRKTLPVIDGGALRTTLDLPARPNLSRIATHAYRVYFKTAARRIAGDRVASLYRSVRWHNESVGGPEEQQAAKGEDRLYRRPMSQVSRKVAATVVPAAVVKRRRENFQSLRSLLKGLPGYRPLWDTLPEGICPLFLPLWVEDRTGLMERLAARGVETFRFGASSPYKLDPGEFPDTATLRDGILCLPVHQDLEANEIEYLAGMFREASLPTASLQAVRAR